MKKILTKSTLFTLLSISIFGSFCFWQWWRIDTLSSDFPYGNESVNWLTCDGNTDLWNCTSIKEDKEKGWDETIIRRLLWVFGLDTDTNKDLKFIDYAKAIINMALWLISFIALIMTIYTFYTMFFAKNDEVVKKAKWNLVWIFIALGVIWLAWLIVSFIFRWYQSLWKDKENEIPNMNISMLQDEMNNQIYLTI